MTTETEERVIDERMAHQALGELAKIEREIDAYMILVAGAHGLKDRKALEKHIESLKGDIKQYLTESGERSIYDGEFDVSARVEVRSTTPSYDLVTAAQTQDGPADLAEAARAGMLKLDNKALERFRGSAGAAWADRLFRFRMPGGATSALYIDKGGDK